MLVYMPSAWRAPLHIRRSLQNIARKFLLRGRAQYPFDAISTEDAKKSLTIATFKAGFASDRSHLMRKIVITLLHKKSETMRPHLIGYLATIVYTGLQQGMNAPQNSKPADAGQEGHVGAYNLFSPPCCYTCVSLKCPCSHRRSQVTSKGQQHQAAQQSAEARSSPQL